MNVYGTNNPEGGYTWLMSIQPGNPADERALARLQGACSDVWSDEDQGERPLWTTYPE